MRTNPTATAITINKQVIKGKIIEALEADKKQLGDLEAGSCKIYIPYITNSLAYKIAIKDTIISGLHAKNSGIQNGVILDTHIENSIIYDCIFNNITFIRCVFDLCAFINSLFNKCSFIETQIKNSSLSGTNFSMSRWVEKDKPAFKFCDFLPNTALGRFSRISKTYPEYNQVRTRQNKYNFIDGSLPFTVQHCLSTHGLIPTYNEKVPVINKTIPKIENRGMVSFCSRGLI